MIALEAASLAILTALLLVWLYRGYLVHSPTARGPVLSADSYPGLTDRELVSVVIPAKDEEENVRAALATVLAQDYAPLEVIVVDDRSADRTPEIVREVAAEDPRVRLVQVERLPEGWFGKPHAVHTGAAEAQGEWLLFVDMDCRQNPHSVRAGLGLALERGGDMVSLWPLLEMHGFWENLVQPVAGSVLVAWFRPQWVNNPNRRTAFANGQYILIRRNVYEAVGGFGAVRDEIVEDIALARVVKRGGYRLLNAVGVDLFTTRMYTSLGRMWQGWTRIYAGAFKRPMMLLAATVLTCLFTLVPFVALAVAGLQVAAGAGGAMDWAVLAVSGATVLAIAVTMRRVFILGRGNPWYLLVYPLAVTITMGFQLGALTRVLGLATIEWRGTRYRGGKVVDEA